MQCALAGLPQLLPQLHLNTVPTAACRAPPGSRSSFHIRPPPVTESYVYAWGRGDLEQLGTGGEGSTSSPQRVQVLDRKVVLHVAANLFNSAFVTGQPSLPSQGPPRLATLSSLRSSLGTGSHKKVSTPLVPRWQASCSTELHMKPYI